MDSHDPDGPLVGIPIGSPVPQNADPEEYSFQQAYAKVMAGIETMESIKESMYPEFAAARNSADSKSYMDVCIYYLLGSGWQWNEFDRCFENFRSQNKWPYTWLEIFPRLLERDELCRMPVNYDEAFSEVHVTDLKTILKRKGINPKPFPRTRDEIQELVRNHISFEAFLSLAKASIDAAQQKRQSWVEKDKCRLLGHTIMMTAGNLRFCYDLQQNKDLTSRKYRLQAIAATADSRPCPIEAEFVARFNSGETNSLPPWFPGDRSCLEVVFE